ncbi:MAG: efflux RND transporter periplasmic adaptor subunit [Planctomycetaceae bacterium]|nr:efflux RND transporter periplasmic adaptor subunit [Planctomycetaceae bacterium]
MIRCANTWRSASFVLALMSLLGCHSAASNKKTPVTPTVIVASPLAEEVADQEEFTGRTVAVSKVTIRARVSGYLVKVNFNDGDVVKKDTLLYEIDPRPFQATLDQALALVERLHAEKKLLEIQVARYRKLASTGAASQQDLDEYLAKQAENVGALKGAEAQVEQARLNLGFTRITSPIEGRISRTLLTVGNLVNADVTDLTTIMSIDPMYAYFDVEEPTFLRLQKLVRNGVIKTRRVNEVPVVMGLADDTARAFPLHGTLDFVNNTVDPQTGTILVRGSFANPYKYPERLPLLTPGLFVRVRLRVGPPRKVLLVTERAIGTDQGQKYVFVVDQDGKVANRRVRLGPTCHGLQAVEGELKPTDRVVVSGLQRVRPGIEVKTEQVDMKTLAVKQPSQ